MNQVVFIYTHGHSVHTGTEIHCRALFYGLEKRESLVAAYLYINGVLKETKVNEYVQA